MSEFSDQPSVRDYVSPGYAQINMDPHFPNLLQISDPSILGCKELLRYRPLHHFQYWDRRAPNCGFVNRDEAHILYNTALRYRDVRALEIGCFLGWSTCHLLAGGVRLDVVDPILKEPGVNESVRASIRSAGFEDRANLVADGSPDAVAQLGHGEGRRWGLVFIDADVRSPRVLVNAFISTRFAEPDCLILLRNPWQPGVMEAMDYLRSEGWNTVVYDTFSILGAAWRGNRTPIAHTPDPHTAWSMPAGMERHPLVARMG